MRPIAMFMPAAVCAAFLLGAVEAQEPSSLELANPDGFNERFAGNTKVSGQFLTGLSLDAGAAKLDLSAVRIIYSADTPGMVCVRLTSDDGRYWAANLYSASGDYLAPPVIPLPTSYDDQLSGYGIDGLLLLAVQSEDCAETSGKLLMPGLFGERVPGAPLSAFINVSQGRPTAWLESEGQQIGDKTTCGKPDGGAKVTYSHICKLDLPDGLEPGTYHLKVAVKGLTGQSVEQGYAISLE